MTTAVASEPGADLITWVAKFLGFYSPPKKKKRLKKDPPVLGPAQQKRAEEKLKALDAKSRAKFEKLTKDVKSPKEKDYLHKALASNYSVDEIEKFAKKIKGKDEKWMKDNLKLTGNSKGKGVQQQWSLSCNATTTQAIRGQLDPIYALKLHEENPDLTDVDKSDATKKNPKLAAEQKKMLESEYSGKASAKHKGVAVSHDDTSGTGRGRWADDLMNDISDVTGVEYENKQVVGKYKVDDAMKDVEKGLKQGHPVPIVIGKRPRDFTHYVLVTELDDGPPKTWTIHDPLSGDTVSREVKDIKDGKINLSGYNQITALDNPSAKK